MRILFVYPGYIVREVPLNVLYVSAAVKQTGHITSLFHFSPYRCPSWRRRTLERIEEGFLSALAEFRPDIVGFSVMIQDYATTKRLSAIAKETACVPVIWGGIQPILEPDRSIGELEVDYICTGEAEKVLPEFLSRLERGENSPAVKGIWGKDSRGNPVRNGRPDLIDDLDSLPFPQRDLLPAEYYRAELTGANILTGRGCPFPCAFCQNKLLMDIFRGKGNFVRYRSLENVFREMEHLVSRYDVPSFYMSDEIFTLNRERVISFCKEYPSRIGRPFMIQTRADLMDGELARRLSDAGCFMVNLAIESGNDRLRGDVLKKNISRQQIDEAFRAVREHGMMSTSFNMIGVPGETMETIKETIAINRQMRPDRILCSIFMPLPGTELGEQCRNSGMLEGDLQDTTNYYSQVVVKNPALSPRALIGYQGFFDWYVLLPRWTHPFVHVLRYLYQLIVSPLPGGTVLGRKLRELTVETVYQCKRFLPRKRLHVGTR